MNDAAYARIFAIVLGAIFVIALALNALALIS